MQIKYYLNKLNAFYCIEERELLMNRIKHNVNLLKAYFVKSLSMLFAILSAILLLIEKENIGIDSMCKAILVFIIAFVIALGYAILMACVYKKIEIFENGRGKLSLKYGDLWKIAFPNHKLKKESKKIVVVSVNTTFDVMVDEKLSNGYKPLVSINTLHGQWIKKMQDNGLDIGTINEAIQENLTQRGISPLKILERTQKDRGNLQEFEKGTIAVYEYNDTIFYLLALSQFDENNNAQNSKGDLIKTIEELIEFYYTNGQGYELYVPLLGTGMSRTDISAEEALQTMVSCFKIFKSKILGDVNIIVYSKQRENVSLDV